MKLSASKGYRGGPGCTPALSLLLRTFLDLDYLLRYKPVSLPVDRFRRFFIWGLGKAEDLARLLVVPVPVILHPVFVLDFEVLLVGFGHRLCGQPFNPPVVIHKEWHITDPPFSSAFPSGLFTLGLYPLAGYCLYSPNCREVGFIECESTGHSSYLSLYLAVLYLPLLPWRTFLPSRPRHQSRRKVRRLPPSRRAPARSRTHRQDQDLPLCDRP